MTSFKGIKGRANTGRVGGGRRGHLIKVVKVTIAVAAGAVLVRAGVRVAVGMVVGWWEDMLLLAEITIGTYHIASHQLDSIDNTTGCA